MEDINWTATLWWIREQLDQLAFLREDSPGAWTDDQEARYAKLCADERKIAPDQKLDRLACK